MIGYLTASIISWSNIHFFLFLIHVTQDTKKEFLTVKVAAQNASKIYMYSEYDRTNKPTLYIITMYMEHLDNYYYRSWYMRA